MLLVLANAVILLWPSKVNRAPHVHSAQPELKPHFVRLNKEIEERFYSKPKSSIVLSPTSIDQNELVESEFPADVAEVSGLADANGAVTESSAAQTGSQINSQTNSQAITQLDGGVCYRLGPFMHSESYELAQAVLFNAGVEYQESTRQVQESDVFRLFLGPYETSAEVADARLDLKRKRILDHFSRKLDDGTYIISLGIYSSEETAQSALRLFADELADVKSQSESVVLPNSYWLHFALATDSSKLEQLSSIDWGENSVKLGPHTCRT